MHVAATEDGQDHGAQRYPSDDEHAYTQPPNLDQQASDEQEDQVRKRKRHDVSSDLLEWAESQLMRTPVSAPPPASFAQWQ